MACHALATMLYTSNVQTNSTKGFNVMLVAGRHAFEWRIMSRDTISAFRAGRPVLPTQSVE